MGEDIGKISKLYYSLIALNRLVLESLLRNIFKSPIQIL